MMNSDFKIKIVLAKTLYDRNIGSTSRVMDNMGVENLILIAPQCEITYEAQLAAATGQHALQNRIQYATWEEFYKNESEGVRFAFTARDGRGRLVKDFDTQLKIFLERHKENLKSEDKEQSESASKSDTLYLIFGPEDAGLAADDLEHCNFCVSLPVYGDNASYNLSHAVMLALFIQRQRCEVPFREPGSRKNDRIKISPKFIEKVDPQPMIKIGETLKEWLTVMGLNLEDHHKVNAYTVIHRMLLQNAPTLKEYNMLETMLQQTIRKLKKLKELEK